MINSLYTAQSGLNSARYSVDVTSNNIANENTEGYTKRVVNTSEISLVGNDGIGEGVSFDEVTRTTSAYLYNQLVSQNSSASYYEQEDSILSNIEIMFSQSDEAGISGTLNEFYDSIESSRANPSDLIYKSELENQSEVLVEQLKTLYTNLDESQEDASSLLVDQVEDINHILNKIVEINEQMQVNNTLSIDLLDKRDALEKELATYADIEINDDYSFYSLKVGGVNAIFNNTMVSEVTVDEEYIAQKDVYSSSKLSSSNFTSGEVFSIVLNNTTTLTISPVTSVIDIREAINSDTKLSNYEASVDSNSNLIIKSKIAGEEGKFDISISSSLTGEIVKSDVSTEAENNVSLAIYNDNLELTSGSTKAITEELTSSTSNILAYKQSLNDFAKALVENTNLNSETSLFNGSSIESLEFIENSVDDLTSDDLENLSQLQWNDEIIIDSNSSEGTSFSEFFQDLLVTISSDVETNNSRLETQNAIVNSLESTYNELTKVDPDEEMINLLQYQAAYEANAKVISTVDEMLQTLLNM